MFPASPIVPLSRAPMWVWIAPPRQRPTGCPSSPVTSGEASHLSAMRGSFSSASGLRPVSAFVVVAVVLALVGGRVTSMALHSDGPRRPRTQSEEGFSPGCTVVDASGRRLAAFSERYELQISPRAMWQAHTPDRMARVLSEVIGGSPDAETILERMLPREAMPPRSPAQGGSE